MNWPARRIFGPVEAAVTPGVEPARTRRPARAPSAIFLFLPVYACAHHKFPCQWVLSGPHAALRRLSPPRLPRYGAALHPERALRMRCLCLFRPGGPWYGFVARLARLVRVLTGMPADARTHVRASHTCVSLKFRLPGTGSSAAAAGLSRGRPHVSFLMPADERTRANTHTANLVPCFFAHSLLTLRVLAIWILGTLRYRIGFTEFILCTRYLIRYRINRISYRVLRISWML